MLLSAIQRVYLASLAPSWARFDAATRRPARAQRGILRRVIDEVAPSSFGREHGLGGVRDLRTFQDRVPVRDYAAYAPWIDRIAAGEGAVLTADPVTMMERTGGSTSTNKLIPYNGGLLADFGAATNAWLYDMHRAVPGLIGTQSYWSVSPATRIGETTDGGVPIGFEDDTEYFGPAARWALGKMMAVPGEVARIPNVDLWRRTTLEHLVASADLGLISVWNPSFLTLLMDALAEDLDAFLGALPSIRRAEIEARIATDGLVGEAIWPRLELVSCWTDGVAADFLPSLRRWFPTVQIQGKGLLATEGVVSFPVASAGGSVAALTSHLIEFIDVEHPDARPVLADSLRVGAAYSPVLSTRGGLVRYHLKDVVRCVGHFRRAPVLRFDGKLDRVSDLTGEKINARQVEAALDEVLSTVDAGVDFVMVAPVWGEPPHYELYIETAADDADVARIAAHVEAYLATGHHYSYARELGQLGPLRPVRVRDGRQTYTDTLVAQGQRRGDIKPTRLDARMLWAEAFADHLTR